MTIRHFIIAAALCSASLSANAQGTNNAAVNYRDRITNMPDYLQNFIDDYIEATHEILNGGVNWLSNLAMSEYVAGIGRGKVGAYCHTLKETAYTTEFTFPSYSSQDFIKQTVEELVQKHTNKAVDTLNSFLPYAFLSLKFDHPEAFWIGNEYRNESSFSYSYNSNPFTGKGTVNYTIKLFFVLHDNYYDYNTGGNYDIRNNGELYYDFRNTSNIARGVNIYNTSVQNILEQCQSVSRHRKLRKVHDWLTTHNCYNQYHYSDPYTYNFYYLGGIPWSPYSALEGNTGKQAPVCEGYARALKVLCDAMDIPCILMSGNAFSPFTKKFQAHMWNYVQMEDGNWYAIDPTWDDPFNDRQEAVSGKESRQWFLLGSEDTVDENLTFIQSHPEDWIVSYPNQGSQNWKLRPGPTLAPHAWVTPDPHDPSGDGIINQDDISLMASKIVNDDDDIDDVDGNDRITIGDLVRIIDRSISK